MRLLIIIDPLDKLKAYKDTSLAIMREASKRGHELFIAMQGDLFLRNEKVCVFTQAFNFSYEETWYKLTEKIECNPNDFDAVLMRKDPPFDNEYLYSTHLLSLAVKQGAKVFNNPDSIRSWNEKLGITNFPQFAPEFLVTRNNELIRSFLKEYGDIVVKPLDGMGGASIFRLRHNDPNISVILETITKFEQETIMAQRYIPDIRQGDKRILLINGEPISYALARIPKAGESRGNLAAGGIGVAQKLTERDYEIALTVGHTMQEQGLFLVGLDVIGDHLTEINVTSPTGMVEISKQTSCKPMELLLNALEQHTEKSLLNTYNT